MAPALAEKYTVVATDLRGYGDSDMPEGGDGHTNYAKRVMAQDQVDVMTALGGRAPPTHSPRTIARHPASTWSTTVPI